MKTTLYHGDCLTEMNKIPDHSVDLILCDLPYGITACKWDVVIPFEPLWKHYWRVLKPNGTAVLFGTEPFSSYLRMSQIKYFKYDWIWYKNAGSGFVNAKKRPMKNHEIISVFYKSQPTYNPIFEKYAESLYKRSNGEIHKKNKTNEHGKKNSLQGLLYGNASHICDLSRGRYPTTIKQFKIPNTSNGQRLHPTQKPVDLLEYLIKTYTNETETVLDNCMGSGSTGIACQNTNRNFIGIEKDEKYFEIAKNRIQTNSNLFMAAS